ncbi:hypothetical protein A6R68_07577, partial [Neotoma lepida]
MIPYTTGLRIFSAISTMHHMVQWPIWHHCHQNTPAVLYVLIWVLSVFSSMNLLSRILCISRKMPMSRLYMAIVV